MALHWRLCTTADVEVVLGFMHDFALFLKLPWDAEQRRANFTHLVEHLAVGGTWLISGDEQPLGYFVLTTGFSYEFGGTTALLDELYVAPAAQRIGVGRQTLCFITKLAEQSKWRCLLLEVSPETESLVKLYSHEGYTPRPYQLYSKRVSTAEARRPV